MGVCRGLGGALIFYERQRDQSILSNCAVGAWSTCYRSFARRDWRTGWSRVSGVMKPYPDWLRSKEIVFKLVASVTLNTDQIEVLKREPGSWFSSAWFLTRSMPQRNRKGSIYGSQSIRAGERVRHHRPETFRNAAAILYGRLS
jgi:hypothetical protein